MTIDIQRNNSVVCTTGGVGTGTPTLTFDGVDTYTGSFFTLGDTFNVNLHWDGAQWTLQVTSPSIGCGFINLPYSESGSPLIGAWPDAYNSGPYGVCGCVDLWINYFNIAVSA